MRVYTTCIDRGNTNTKVFTRANEKLEEEGKKRKKVVSFIEAYTKLQRRRAFKIIREPNSEIYKVSFQGSKLRKWVHNKRRAGRPRLSWTEETAKEIWDYIKKYNPGYRLTAFNGEKEDIIELIRTYTREGEATSTR